MNFLKKYHKWLGLIFILILFIFSVSGVILNHRKTFSGVDVNRQLLPENYRYRQWNNAAVIGTTKISTDSILLYGNVGIWLYDSLFQKHTDFNTGFPKGIDNRKISDIVIYQNDVVAASFFGLFRYDKAAKKWKKLPIPLNEERIVDLLVHNDSLYVMTRSYLFKTKDLSEFTQIHIPAPENYDHKIGLFKTLWVIHSGEIYGLAGKLLVDLMAVVLIFLSVTGFYFFLRKSQLRKNKLNNSTRNKYKNQLKWHLRWHNKIGWTTSILLLITATTGMFLRPPLLAAIGNARVGKIPFTELATANPWFDILRRIDYDHDAQAFILATMDGFFYSADAFQSELKPFYWQPPASVMGVTVLEKKSPQTWLVGSFMGLFEWNPTTGMVIDYITKLPYTAPSSMGSPIGNFKISGYTKDFRGQEIVFDYDKGAGNLTSDLHFTSMPEEIILKSPLSLWNTALEFHTSRIFQPLIGSFYVLIIPITGLVTIFIVISGFIVWYKLHRNNGKEEPESEENIGKNDNQLITNTDKSEEAALKPEHFTKGGAQEIITDSNPNTPKTIQTSVIMSKNIYKVSSECISCRACVEVAPRHFAMNDQQQAYVFHQPENETDEKICQEAMEVCPVEAISRSGGPVVESNVAVIYASANIKETLDKYPELKDILSNLSPKFKKMQNPALYNTLARFATFKDAAKVTGVSLCAILHVINKHLGVEDKLIKSMPECIQNTIDDDDFLSTEISWTESPERYIYNADSMPELIEKLSNLQPQENLVILSVENPAEFIRVAEGMHFSYNIEKGREYRVSVFNPQKTEQADWTERREFFEQLDVRTMTSDPFDIIIKKAYEIPEDDGFILIQRFEPYPMINMLHEMGFEHITEYRSYDEIWVYFHKIPVQVDLDGEAVEKTEVVVQSATPVAYPVIMRLLQSEKIRKSLKIKELKVWEETEKHLAWIASGKADISFSALITSAKLRNSDVKIPALFVWDNFVILTRGYEAKSLADLKGHVIHTPLFEEAPPTKITKYLLKISGLNPDEFQFTYGEPFGRPEKIYADFVTGLADTVILREPEASYAIKIMQDRHTDISILSFSDIWNQHNPGFGSFPNAGLVLKGEFSRKHPELTQVLLQELQLAIDWVNQNREEAANLSFDMMRQPADRVELFLERVNFDYVDGERLLNKVKSYFDVLAAQNIIETKLDEGFYEMFKL